MSKDIWGIVVDNRHCPYLDKNMKRCTRVYPTRECTLELCPEPIRLKKEPDPLAELEQWIDEQIMKYDHDIEMMDEVHYCCGSIEKKELAVEIKTKLKALREGE